MRNISLRLLMGVSLLCVVLSAPAYGAVKGEQIRQSVVRHIEQSMPWPKESARIDIASPADVQGLEKKGLVMRVENSGNEEYVGEMTFLVRLSDGRQQRQVTVRGRVEILREVLVSGRPLARDTIITPADVMTKRKWVRHLDPDLLSSPENAVGKRVLMSVRGGAELKSQMLREPVVIKKGRSVRINLERGAMVITTMGISEEDGAAGALIRVRNMSSNRLVYAKVMGEDVVRVDF